MSVHKTIGLALGSGGYRGFAHIGVIKSLEKHKIPINYLSGCSSGAIVAAYYALFNKLDKLEQDLINNRRDKISFILDFSRTGGIISGHKFKLYLEKILEHKSFSNLKIPLRIIATDILSGQAYVLDHGKLAAAVRASSSVPLIFKPFSYQGKLLVDGGLSNPVPINLVKEMGADITIGVNLYHRHEFIVKKITRSNILPRTSIIALHNLAQASLRDCDIVIEPDISPLMRRNGLARYFTKEVAEKIMIIGERAADKMIPVIKAKLKL